MLLQPPQLGLRPLALADFRLERIVDQLEFLCPFLYLLLQECVPLSNCLQSRTNRRGSEPEETENRAEFAEENSASSAKSSASAAVKSLEVDQSVSRRLLTCRSARITEFSL